MKINMVLLEINSSYIMKFLRIKYSIQELYVLFLLYIRIMEVEDVPCTPIRTPVTWHPVLVAVAALVDMIQVLFYHSF